MVNENRKNRIKIAFIILLMSISLGALSYSFGFVGSNHRGVTSNYFSVSAIDFGLTSDVDSVSLGKILPTLDKFGIMNESFSFTITNTSNTLQNYVVKLIDGEKYSTIPNKEIRYQLMIDDMEMGIYNLSNSGVIDSGQIEINESHKYSIKIWLDYNSNQTSGVFEKIVFVDAGDNNLDTSGANKPSLSDGMIPVFYDEKMELWRKADEDNSDHINQWYDYDSLMWANVVTVNEEKRDFYVNASLGTEIKMDDINAFWVWIPRYKYTIFDSKNPSMINILFENGIKSTGSVVCTSEFDEINKFSEICQDNLNGGIKEGVSTYTHPAFTFGEDELEGFWVAKFEAGVIDGDENIYIKPNIESLGYITMDVLLTKFRKMGLVNNIYGFIGGKVLNPNLTIDEDKNAVDTHMIKNSEWGAIAYLYHSKYGKYGNNNYSGSNKKIYHNNSVMTGYSTGSSGAGGSYQYNVSLLGTGASTTGNVYGVYDMNGGKGEMVMTNFQNIYGNYVPINNSSFKNNINIKYYDAYFMNNNILVTNLGDGLKETKWYSNTQNILSDKVLYRGGIVSSYNDGIFGINTMSDSTSINIGSRPILVTESNVYITKW